MDRQITLTRSAQQQDVNGNVVMGYRFTVLAVGTDMESAVFKMNQRPKDVTAQPTDPVNDFQGICTPEDLQNLPVNAPIPPDTRFRVDLIDVKYDTQEQGEEAWEDIQSGVDGLRIALNIMDNLNVVETVQSGP
jgi:hypothetical protein